ncbi:MFS transporter [Streptomyces bugieae]
MLPTLLVAMDMTALLLALPRLSADLGATGVQQLWISDSYGLMVAGLVITMGTLGDRIGRRRLLMIGGAAFAVLSVVAAFAVGPLMLIVARALLGVAGATLAPSTLALITNMFRDERPRGQAIAVWATCVALVFAGLAMAGTGLLVTQYLQSVLGFSPVASAVLFAPMGLGVAVGTMAAPALARRMRQTTAIAGGLVGSALGSLLLVGVGIGGASALPLVMTGIAVLALGTGPLFALGTGLVVGSVPPERAGSAASMSETGNYFGGSLGFALLGLVAAVIYRGRMHGTSDSLAGAVATSRHLPAGRRAELLHTAREAFTSSLHVTGLTAAVLFAGLAVLTLTMRPAARTTPAALPDYETTGA